MAIPNVTGTIQRADGTAVNAGTATFTLNQIAFLAGTAEVVTRSATATANSSGAFTTPLQRNSDLTPSNTFYTVTLADSSGTFLNGFNIQVPAGAGPFEVSSILFNPAGAGVGSMVTAVDNITGLANGQVPFGTATTPVSRAIAESDVTNLVSDLAAKATDSLAVHLAGTETITGAKTFSAGLGVVAGQPYTYDGHPVITALTALDNYFFGPSGNLTMSGNYNTASGASALQANTTGYYNTASGANALQSNTTGNNNTAIGFNTGQGLVTGINNTIIGANVTGLAAGLSNAVIIADGSGNQRIVIDSTGKGTFNGGLAVTGNSGFNGTAPIAKPTVTGSRGANAALASLLTALAAYGLVTDSST